MDNSREARDLLIEKSRWMRKNPTPAESLLWHYLRNRQLNGFKFRRQHIIHNFIVDFYCPAAKLVIEVDGDVHQSQQQYDQVRQDYLQEMGNKVIRFNNDDIFNNILNVLDMINQGLSSQTQ
jgi:adenine-specific DNA-methyltransferase